MKKFETYGKHYSMGLSGILGFIPSSRIVGRYTRAMKEVATLGPLGYARNEASRLSNTIESGLPPDQVLRLNDKLNMMVAKAQQGPLREARSAVRSLKYIAKKNNILPQ